MSIPTPTTLSGPVQCPPSELWGGLRSNVLLYPEDLTAPRHRVGSQAALL